MELPCSKHGTIIVGAGYGVDKATLYAKEHPSYDVWCVSKAYPSLLNCKNPIFIFEFHPIKLWLPFVRHHVTRNLVSLYPDQAKYHIPTESLIKEFGDIFTSTFAWMIAYALHKKTSEIALFGISLDDESERHQRSAVEFLLGCAKVSGVKTVISRLSPLYYISTNYGNSASKK